MVPGGLLVAGVFMARRPARRSSSPRHVAPRTRGSALVTRLPLTLSCKCTKTYHWVVAGGRGGRMPKVVDHDHRRTQIAEAVLSVVAGGGVPAATLRRVDRKSVV